MGNPCGFALDMSRSGLTVLGRLGLITHVNGQGKIGGRIPLPMAETALKADVCGKAVPWATKKEVMHDPWVVFDHG
ncbi:hypothetical protein F2Q69_00063805 [Brassica cretica]|uniref:Uncharacterized protein n=1 Tax=Brassica cretica TaxID=69181 RepID=A0A8S9RFP4_BRACR|nr:hypothetical protein F2Q69_00063805 [Brassica cretica]